MFGFRNAFPFVVALSSAVIITSAMASSFNNPINSSIDVNEISRDVEAYASSLKIDLETANYQLMLQKSAGYLDAELNKWEDNSYGGLWIQHSPQFRIIVQYTKSGEETIKPYIKNHIYTDYIETRLVNYSLKELKDAQTATQFVIRNLGISTDSGINLVENRVDLYVVGRSQLDAIMQNTNIQLPHQTQVVTVNELGTQDADIYAGLRINASDQADCTSGFSVIHSSGIKGILTAAHCDNSMSYNGISLPFQSSALGGAYDFQWHTAPGFDVRNLIFDGTNNRFVFSTKHRVNQVVGEWVCKYGRVSGYSCGYITDKFFNPGGAMNNTLIRVHQDGVDLSSGGDSGGPWFFANTAYGVHIGGIGDDAYYMAINYIDYLNLSVLANTIYLPLILTNSHQSQNVINQENYDPYPAPYDEDASKLYQPSSQPNPYP